MRSNNEIFGTLAVIRDAYSMNVRAARNKEKQRRKDMMENLKAGSPAFIRERDSIGEDFKHEIDSAKEEALREIETAVFNAQAREKAKVRLLATTTESMRQLEALKDVPVSVEEFNELCAVFGGRNYWVDKNLRKIASENGIEKTPMLEPDFSSKMAVINDLEKRFTDFVKYGDPEELNMPVCDVALRMAEETFTGNYCNYEFSPERRALQIIDKAQQARTPFEVAGRINNALMTADLKTCWKILEQVEKDSAYWNNIRSLGGLSAGIAQFKARQKKEYQEIASQCADNSMIAEVSRLSLAERTIAKDASGSNMITRKGLDYLRSAEGRSLLADVRSLDRSLKAENREEMTAQRERQELAEEQARIEKILNS